MSHCYRIYSAHRDDFEIVWLCSLMMRLSALIGTGSAILLALSTSTPAGASGFPSKDVTNLRVLSYNIQALPPPIKKGKAPLFERIAELLRERRQNDTHPHVVLLQEAFDSKSDVIAETSGYKYILRGPGRKTNAKLGKAHWVPQTRKAYVSFTDPQKFMGSGLMIMSDYPIVAGHHKSFHSDECAGIDCLANKSIQLARIEVPGVGQPIDIVNSHFNSRKSAAAPTRITLKIHHKQTDKLKWFLEKASKGNPLIVAGDFNTKQPERYSYFDRTLGLIDAGKVCLSDTGRCKVAEHTEQETILFNTNDKHFYSGSKRVALHPYFIERNFSEKLDGRELSDHLGYEVHYTVVSTAGTSGEIED